MKKGDYVVIYNNILLWMFGKIIKFLRLLDEGDDNLYFLKDVYWMLEEIKEFRNYLIY